MNISPRRPRVAALILFAVAVSGLSWAGKDKDQEAGKHYALIFGTVFGPDEQPFYGARILIHPQGKKHPKWELSSDHVGEFAVRVPPGPEDYVVEVQAEIVPVENGKPQMHKKKRVQDQTTLHITKEERQDIGLHLK
ncbi:MAG TPA: hypothetical protein VKT33_10400 [Candidatus Angelobacter sp.]|nr:hypothetical protein [Candidatus Angelobacter sp.]